MLVLMLVLVLVLFFYDVACARVALVAVSLPPYVYKRRISLQLRPSPQATIGTLTLRKHFPFLWNYANVDITV